MVTSPPSTAAAPPGLAGVDALLQAQARRVRVHGAVCCAWLLLFSLGGIAALGLAGVRLTPALGALGLLAPLVGLALLASPVQPARRYTLHLLAATLFLPIGLLFAAASLDLDPIQPTPARLDAQRLFAGAAVVADSDLSGAGIVLMRSGAFADGSELRLMRFTEVETAREHVAMLDRALHGETFAAQGRHGVRLRNGVLPDSLMLIERHGADVLELRARDVAGGLARLALQQVPAPAPEAAPAGTMPRWLFFIAAAMAHGLAFVALIVWGGRWTTRVPAAPGATAVNAAALCARLASFAASPRAPFMLVASSETRIVFDVPMGPLRSHRIALALDAARREVGVTERIGVHGDRPRDAAEASLRSAGEAAFDPSRPDADRVWQTYWQATMVDPVRLAAVPLHPLALHAELPPAYAAALDGEGVVTALCALVTRSGWHWQPRLGRA